jgi:hypothetical protein
MPAFDLRYINVCYAELQDNGTIRHRNKQLLGDAMTVNMELRFAEAKAWAESNIAAALRWVISGTISIGVDWINPLAYVHINDMFVNRRTVDPDVGRISGNGVAMAKYKSVIAGLAFYAPDMVNGVEKFLCVFAPWVRLSPPTQGFNTLGENVTFSTPTLTGEILPAPVAGHPLFETGFCDTEAQAVQWVNTVLNGTYS